MPEPEARRRVGVVVGDIALLVVLVGVVFLAWRRLGQRDWFFWVYAGLAVCLLVSWVLLLVAALRRPRPPASGPPVSRPALPTVVTATDQSAPPGTAGDTDSPSPPLPVGVRPAVDHTPQVPAEQAVGYGWARAADLASPSPDRHRF